MNLLDMALGTIGTQTVTYKKFLSRTTNEIGLDEDTYDVLVDIEGSFQPVPKNIIANLGLDISQHHFNFYVSKDILELDKFKVADVIVDGKTVEPDSYKIQKLDWVKQEE